MVNLKTRHRLLLILLLCACTSSVAGKPDDTEALRNFAAEMQNRHGMKGVQIEALLMTEAEYQQDIIDAITRPAEALPWHRYRRIFLTEERIEEGINFKKTHAELLSRAEAEFGVEPAIIAAIIGVETFYGRYRGRHRVIDALRTLGFSYPPRQDFFRRELEAFLLLSAEEGFDPATPLGSYAGAMGVPQFISSSYRAYAVDFSGNGRRDLFSDMADVIGSVANYFAEHRWKADAPIAVTASVNGEAWQAFLPRDLRPRDTVGTLREAGVSFADHLDAALPARLLALEGEAGPEYWVTFDNFYAITRYNHSPLYALAVFQLAKAIDEVNQ